MSIDTAENVVAEGTWQVDPIHSTVAFAVRHMVVSTFRGRFEAYDARLETVNGVSVLTGSVEVGSIVVKEPDLAAHLQSPDFFDASRHPQLRFQSTSVRRAGGELELDGDLTIKGVTSVVTARGRVEGPLDDPFGSRRLGLELEAAIDRRAHGLEWNLPLPKGGFALANEVKLLVNLEFTPVG